MRCRHAARLSFADHRFVLAAWVAALIILAAPATALADGRYYALRLNPNLYDRWSKEFLEAGKTRLLGDTTREATSSEVAGLRQENARLSRWWPRRCSRTGCSRRA